MKYYSEMLGKMFDTPVALLNAEAEARKNDEEAMEIFKDIDDILGLICADMAYIMQEARDVITLAAEAEKAYGVKYKFNRDVIGDIAEHYLELMCDDTNEDDAYTEQCLEAWDDAWNGNNDSCPCCGASGYDCDCDPEDNNVCENCGHGKDCPEREENLEGYYEYAPFFSINLRNPIFQNFIHEYRNIAPLKKLAEEFPSISEMFDRLESGND